MGCIGHEIVKMNLSHLYEACVGISDEKMKNFETGNKNTQHLVTKYGYDTKSAMVAFRSLDLLERFYYTGFNNFKKSIT